MKRVWKVKIEGERCGPRWLWTVEWGKRYAIGEWLVAVLVRAWWRNRLTMRDVRRGRLGGVVGGR
jgi:hypothetical protein